MTENVVWQSLAVKKAQRAECKGQKPCIIWLTGLSGSGKSTIANELESELIRLGAHTYLLDGDNLRHGLNKDLGFSDEDREENIRRVAEVAKLFVDAGLIVITAFISPFQRDRDIARGLVKSSELVEVFIDTPLDECERRDPKGLYRKARAGLISNFTGIDSAYEAPQSPEVHLQTLDKSPQAMAEQLLGYLRQEGYLQ
jgi:adenylylsulfate kinase